MATEFITPIQPLKFGTGGCDTECKGYTKESGR